MMIENNYDVGYCNGDVGLIKEINLSKNSIVVEINSENIEIPHSLIKDITLCYACTIHKSQGSEYDHVIIALPAEPTSILQRNLIYTALTRAKKYAAIIYENNALAETIKRNYITKRKTNLKNQLTQTFTNKIISWERRTNGFVCKKIMKKEVSFDNYIAMCDRFEQLPFHCGDWWPTIEDIKLKLEPKLEQNLEFLIWISETASAPKTEVQKASR